MFRNKPDLHVTMMSQLIFRSRQVIFFTCFVMNFPDFEPNLEAATVWMTLMMLFSRIGNMYLFQILEHIPLSMFSCCCVDFLQCLQFDCWVIHLSIISSSAVENRKLCAVCKEIFKKEPMLLEPSAGLTVVGNIHGWLGLPKRRLETFQRKNGRFPDVQNGF